MARFPLFQVLGILLILGCIITTEIVAMEEAEMDAVSTLVEGKIKLPVV